MYFPFLIASFLFQTSSGWEERESAVMAGIIFFLLSFCFCCFVSSNIMVEATNVTTTAGS